MPQDGAGRAVQAQQGLACNGLGESPSVLMLAPPALPLLLVSIGLFTGIVPVLVVGKITSSLRNDTLWEVWI